MGDRGNIQISQPEAGSDLFLYTHWAGSYICPILAEGLARCKAVGRLTDPAYATRIIFDTLTGCEGTDTGFGISVETPCDNEHPIPNLYWGPTFGQLPVVFYNGGEFTVEAFIDAWGDGATERAEEWANTKSFSAQVRALSQEMVCREGS